MRAGKRGKRKKKKRGEVLQMLFGVENLCIFEQS
jgi:hypothetical protein